MFRFRFLLNHTENGNLDKSFGRRFKPHILPNRDPGIGWCQNGRALPPALPCHLWLDLHEIPAFGHKIGNPFKIFAKHQIVLFEQNRVSEFINSMNHERMQHCISNENIQQMKSRTAAELSSEMKIHSSCNYSPVTWALSCMTSLKGCV